MLAALTLTGCGSRAKPAKQFSGEPLGSCTYSGSGNGQQVFVLDNVTKARCDELKGTWSRY
jgi:uncharacterized lipoprotein YmbA